jgi:hypothetical protein
MTKLAEKLSPVNLSFLSLRDQPSNSQDLTNTKMLNSICSVTKYFDCNPTHYTYIELNNGTSTDRYDIYACEHAVNNNHYHDISEKIFNYNKDSHTNEINRSLYINTLDFTKLVTPKDIISISLKIKKHIYNFELPSLNNRCIPSFVINRDIFDFLGVKNILKDVEFNITFNNLVYRAFATYINCYINNTVIIFIKEIIQTEIYNIKLLKTKTNNMEIYGHTFEIIYPEYNDEITNEIHNLQPYFIKRHCKYPIFIYKITLDLYIECRELNKSQRDICNFIKNTFGLESLNHSTLSRLYSNNSKKIGIYEFEKMTEEQKNIHDNILLKMDIKVNKSIERKNTHYKFRRLYLSFWTKYDINFNWVITSRSIILPDDYINTKSFDINSELLKFIGDH